MENCLGQHMVVAGPVTSIQYNTKDATFHEAPCGGFSWRIHVFTLPKSSWFNNLRLKITHSEELVNWLVEWWQQEQQQKQQVNGKFSNKIIFNNEAYFDVNGFVNKLMSCIGRTDNPYVFYENRMYTKCVIVCCGYWTGVIVE